jgi:antitoxin (DNA-binding transcriptional repressor) of toxin-antitoxin stability system
MKTLTIREAREGLSHPERMFADDDEVLVVRRGKPVARILPLESATQPRFLPSLKWLRDQMPLQQVASEILIREDRDARD